MNRSSPWSQQINSREQSLQLCTLTQPSESSRSQAIFSKQLNHLKEKAAIITHTKKSPSTPLKENGSGCTWIPPRKKTKEINILALPGEDLWGCSTSSNGSRKKSTSLGILKECSRPAIPCPTKHTPSTFRATSRISSSWGSKDKRFLATNWGSITKSHLSWVFSRA